MSFFQAGFGRADITPPVGCVLTGFIARVGPSTGVDAPLSASTLFIQSPQGRAVIAAVDVLGIAHADAEQFARELATIAQCEPGNVVIASSHTHSGPRSMPLRGIGGPEPEVMAILRRGLMQSCKAAIASASSVRASWSRAPIKLGQNRREKTAQGIVLGHKSDGPCDSDVTALFLESELGKRPIVLYSHACHPYCLTAASNLISADFCGHANRALSSSGFDSLFLNGCAGDIAPIHSAPEPSAASEEGARLAAAVQEAFQSRAETTNFFSCQSKSIELPHDKLAPMSEIRAETAKIIRELNSNRSANPRVVESITQAYTHWLNDLTAATANSSLAPAAARASLVRIGDGAIAALPGEIFNETGRAIAQRIRANHVIASAYCHGFTGYAPTPAAHLEGGYEVNDAHKYLGLWKLSPVVPALLEETIASMAV